MRKAHLSIIQTIDGATAHAAAEPRPADSGHQKLLLPVHAISPNPDNPRRVFEERALDALADSIRRWGQLQPVVVRRIADGFQLVCGERRWRAHVRGGFETIWAVELDVSKQDALALALVENLQRVDLSHVEKVAALDELAEIAQVRGLRRLAAQLGVDPSWLSRQLSVRRDPIVFPALEAGDIGFGQAAELLRAPAETRQALLLRAIESPVPVRTAVIRAWVEEARDSVRGDTGAPSRYWKLVEKLNEYGTPRSADDRAALEELSERVQRLLADSLGLAATGQDQGSGKRTWVDLSCLLCGEEAGWMVDGRELRPRRPNSVRLAGNQLLCGRCGGKLTAGQQREQYFYTY
jgi:ParB/RepB/Spo0J family partition protein